MLTFALSPKRLRAFLLQGGICVAQKLKLRTHTDLDLPLVEEMQHVADRVLVPNCIRKSQAFYLGMGVLCLGIGAGSVLAGRQPLVGAVFGLLALAMLGWGALAYRIAARKTCRQMEKAVRSTDYVLEKESVWASNGKGDFHYPYASCVRLVETEKNVYFVTQQGDTLVLSKANLRGGTPEELRLWLTEQCRQPMVALGPHWSVNESIESNQKKENPQ